MPSILFACTANRFRSPLAAACFRRELVSRNLQDGWRISSAGTWTTDGLPATPAAIAGAKHLGIDLGDHRSSSITAQMLTDARLIIVMEQGQKEALEIEFPQNAHKVHLISEAVTGKSFDIPDPTSNASASEIQREIDELIHNGFDRICALAVGN